MRGYSVDGVFMASCTQNQNYFNQIAQRLRKNKMFKTANLSCACDPAGL